MSNELSNDHGHRDDRSTFDPNEEQWFTQPPRRPSQRPTLPAPAMPLNIDDSIADGWFYDV